MSSLALYRTLIPDHASIDDAVVTTYLELAASRHTASTLGAAYPSMMVWWAAHAIARTPGLGSITAYEPNAVMSQRDGDLQRQYEPGGNPLAGDQASELRTTTYGKQYLAALASRASVTPRVLGWGSR